MMPVRFRRASIFPLTCVQALKATALLSQDKEYGSTRAKPQSDNKKFRKRHCCNLPGKARPVSA